MKRKKRSTYLDESPQIPAAPVHKCFSLQKWITQQGQIFQIIGSYISRSLPSLYCIAPMFQIGRVLNCAVFCKPQVIYQKVLDAPLDIWYQKQNRKYLLLFQLTCFKNKTNIKDENLNLIPSFQSRSFEYISVLIWLRPPCKSCKKLIKARQKID